MQKVLPAFIFTIISACMVTSGLPALSAETLDFAVIQPGQPGTSREAQPVMDSLAAYLQKKIGQGTHLKGVYFNELSEALDFIRSTPPRWAIVSPGFYAEHAERLGLSPIASTRPGGNSKDAWHLMVPKDAPDDWHKLTGNVWGTMFYEKNAGVRLLFGEGTDRLPFSVSGTQNPLRYLRSLAGDKAESAKAAGVVLNRVQFDAMQSLPMADELKRIFTSRELPTSPVVSFGKPDDKVKRIGTALISMRGDPEAKELLMLLQTDGFGPADPDLSKLKTGAVDEGSS